MTRPTTSTRALSPRGSRLGRSAGVLIAALYAPDRVKSLAVLSRPHPAAFARALKFDSEQGRRSGHHKAYQDATAATDIRDNDMAQFRKAFALQGVPAETAQAYIRTLEAPGALEAAIEPSRGVSRNG